VEGVSVPAVVLAAGLSERLGQPKALVQIGGEALIVRAWNELRKAGCTPIMVVVNDELAFKVQRLLPEAHLVINPHPETGRTGTLQRGLEALMTNRDALPEQLVMAPVDRPGWRAEVVRRLLDEGGCVAPSSRGRNGHPVVLDMAALQKVNHAPPDVSLRDLLVFEPVDVDAPWLKLNIDTAEDLVSLARHEVSLKAYFQQGEGI
jgi:CTP:molybdopterin cytidylyltransferase MocA